MKEQRGIDQMAGTILAAGLKGSYHEERVGVRAALVIAMATLTLGLASRPIHGQIPAGDAPALKTIHMIDAQTGWGLTESVLLRSTDGGIHWRDVTPLSSSGHNIYVFKITVHSSGIAWVIPSSPSGPPPTEIFRTIDGGRTWRSVTIPAPAVTSISFINPREGWLLASFGAAMMKEDWEIYRSTDGGETWIKTASATQDSGKTAITFLNPTTGWLMGPAVPLNWINLLVTHDGGRTWRHQNLPLPPHVTLHWEARPRPLQPFTAQDGILRIDYSLINDSGEKMGMVVVFYTTHDAGATWTYTVPIRRVSDFYPSSFADMNHGWLMDGYELYVTSDGGRRWTTIHLWMSLTLASARFPSRFVRIVPDSGC